MVVSGAAVGGTGGSPSVMRCPGNGIAVGLTGGAGGYVDRLALVCANQDIDAPDRLATTFSLSEMVGGQTAGSFERSCEHPDLRETAIVGFDFRAGTRVDQIRPICAVPAAWRAGNASTFQGPAIGGNSGAAYRRLCPQGSFVVGFNARSGAAIDRLQVLCSSQASPRI